MKNNIVNIMKKNKVAIGIPSTVLAVLFLAGAPVLVLVVVLIGGVATRHRLHSLECNGNSFLESLKKDLQEMRGEGRNE